LKRSKETGSDILVNLKVYLLQRSFSENSLSIGALELENLRILFKTSKMLSMEMSSLGPYRRFEGKHLFQSLLRTQLKNKGLRVVMKKVSHFSRRA
jgi:hypothetical protein